MQPDDATRNIWSRCRGPEARRGRAGAATATPEVRSAVWFMPAGAAAATVRLVVEITVIGVRVANVWLPGGSRDGPSSDPAGFPFCLDAGLRDAGPLARRVACASRADGGRDEHVEDSSVLYSAALLRHRSSAST